MSNKLSKNQRDTTKRQENHQLIASEFKLRVVKESHHLIMISGLFVAAFTIYFQLQTTLISLLDTSRLFFMFGLLGFVVLFLLRSKFFLTVLDGLYYSIFAIAPVLLATYLFINSLDKHEYQEVYRIVGLEFEGRGYTYELENDTYKEFWRIRNFPEPPKGQHAQISYTFCEGFLGHKTIKSSDLLYKSPPGK